MRSLSKIVAFILLFAGTILLIHFGSLLLFDKDPNMLSHHGPSQVLFYLLFVGYVFIFQKFVNRETFLSLGLEPYPEWWKTVLKGWAVGVAGFLGYHLIMVAAGVIEFQVTDWSKFWMRLPVAFIVAFSAFGVAVTEDILFRGFFFQTLRKELPVWPSILITGIIFGFFHKLNQPLDFLTIPYDAMLFGGVYALNILLCMAYLKSGSLYLPIGIHSGLVFTKVVFRKLKVIHVLQEDSFLFGLGGDARRGFLCWIFFVAGVLILKFLIAERERRIYEHRFPNPN